MVIPLPVLLLCLLPLLPAQSVEQPASNADAGNAALCWWPAIVLKPRQADEMVEAVQRRPLTRLAHRDPGVDQADFAFARPIVSLDLLAAGAALPRCDWGADDLVGKPTLHPCTEGINDLVQLALARARWRAAGGEHAAALADIALVLRSVRLAMGGAPAIPHWVMCFRGESAAYRTLASIAPLLPADLRRRADGLVASLPARPAVPALAVISEDQITLTRLQLQVRAGLALLERGDGALADFPDPVTGRPFRLERLGPALRLSTPIEGGLPALVVGEPPPAPAPASTSPATAEQ